MTKSRTVQRAYGSLLVIVLAGGGVGRSGALLPAAAAAPRVCVRLPRGAVAARAVRVQDGRPADDERQARAHPAPRAARRDRAAHEGDPRPVSAAPLCAALLPRCSSGSAARAPLRDLQHKSRKRHTSYYTTIQFHEPLMSLFV